MKPCHCPEPHQTRRIVLTGGPGAGKTALLELIRQSFCIHVKVLPEAAGIVFGGGFPRGDSADLRRAAQRAIFHVQRELENAADAEPPAVTLCDRGTIDGAAYWPGPGSLWSDVGVSREDELARYHAVIHLRTPRADQGYNQQNPLRIESAEQAAAIDDRIAAEWQGHPRVFTIEPESDFLVKAGRALSILRLELPACCRDHVVEGLDAR